MSQRPLPATGTAAAEDELLAQLGLPASASPEDVDNLHDAVSQYLAAAPSGIRGWAHAQAAALDAAYLSLTDPVGLEGSALRSPTRPPAVVPGGPATPPVRRDSIPAEVPVAAAAAVGAADVNDHEDLDDLEIEGEPDAEELAALYASVTPSAHEDMAPSKVGRPTKQERREARRQAAPAAAPVATKAEPNIWKRIVLGGVAVIAIAAVALGANAVVNGNPDSARANGGSTAQASPTAPTAPAVDQAKVSGLMAKYQSNPQDIDNLMALADEFYAGQQFETSATWLEKILAIDPENVKAMLARGAVYFNLNDMANAESTWKKVVVLEPDNVEAHYDLGFLYLNQTTPDLTGVQREWNRVIELDPGSQLATTVQSHLDQMVMASMIPAPSGAPAASPAGSPAPSGSPAANVLNQTAVNLAYGTSTLAAPANTPFTIRFDNQESGLPHDIQIKDAAGKVVFAGEMVTGPKAVDYAVPALAAGAYTFLCSIHPTMTGTLTVGS